MKKIYGDKGEIPEGEYLVPIGKADIKRKGEDVTIVSFGKIIKVAHEAAEALEKEKAEYPQGWVRHDLERKGEEAWSELKIPLDCWEAGKCRKPRKFGFLVLISFVH